MGSLVSGSCALKFCGGEPMALGYVPDAMSYGTRVQVNIGWAVFYVAHCRRSAFLVREVVVGNE